MALTVETGAGVPGADSYISLAAADAYMVARGHAAWNAATDDDQEAAIRRATDWIDRRYMHRWLGSKALAWDVSPLQWPRADVLDSGGRQIVPANVIPQPVKDATAEAALRELIAPGSLAPDAERAGRVSLAELEIHEGVRIRTDYAGDGATAGPIFPLLEMVLRPLLRPVSGWAVR